MKKINPDYHKMLWNNTQVFLDTYHLSLSKYADSTQKMIDGIDIYNDAADIEINPVVNDDMAIQFVSNGTVNTAHYIKQYYPDYRVAMLNFADAKRPGGWVNDGAPTQEENMCRCTNLYVGLTQQKCADKYYSVNDVYHTDEHFDEAYTDALIYLPNVSIFKNDVDYHAVPVVDVDVITSPAPCGRVKNVRSILEHRIEGIIKSAYAHGVNALVLGAWGCGAFGQNPRMVASCFARVLSRYKVFDAVVFAIKDTPGTASNEHGQAHYSIADDFEGVFFSEYIDYRK